MHPSSRDKVKLWWEEYTVTGHASIKITRKMSTRQQSKANFGDMEAKKDGLMQEFDRFDKLKGGKASYNAEKNPQNSAEKNPQNSAKW